VLRRVRATNAAIAERRRVAVELLGELRRVDADLGELKTRTRTAVLASGTTVTDVFGVGSTMAAYLVGYSGDVRRFPTAGHYARYNGTAPSKRPRESASGIGSTRGETASSTTPCTSPPSPRSATTRRAAPTTTANSSRAKPRRKRCAPSSGASATPSTANSRPTPAADQRAREGNQGQLSTLQRGRLNPEHRTSEKATPGPTTTLRPPPAGMLRRAHIPGP
jgi:transposase